MAARYPHSNADTEKSSCRITNKDNEVLAGVVITLKNDAYGFIKPKGGLPLGFRDRDVFFSIKLAHGVEVYEGDAVTFLLKDGSEQKPEAKQLWMSERPLGWKPPAKKTRMTERIQTQGKICKFIESGCGFIRVEGNVPNEYAGFSREIYFDPSWVQCGEMKLSVGDTVEFNVSVSKRRENKLAAHQIKLAECRPRSPHEVHEHIAKLIGMVQTTADEDMDVILSILRCDAAWRCIGRCWAIESDTVSMLLNLFEILQNKSKALSQYFSLMVATFAKTEFCNTQSGCFKIFVETAWTSKKEPFQSQVKKFILMLLDQLPGKSRTVAAFVKGMIPEGTEHTEHFLYLVIKKISALNLDDISDFEWNELPLVPSTNELMMGPLEFLDNVYRAKTHGPYESVEEYMDIYFRLLRADCFSALRTGIQSFLKGDLDPRDMHIYSEVSLVNVRIIDRGCGVTLGLKVKPQKKIDDWKTCSNLQFGNLLCISPSGSFKDPIWATVTERDDKILKSRGIIWVELCTICNNHDDGTCITNIFEANGRTIVAESPTYYIAYQPVLKALQKSDTETLAFQDLLVNLQPPSPPAYFDPSSIKVQPTMDESQNHAFTQALSQQIGIIQGPPGTGKTFIGIRLIQHLLEQGDNVKFPILILTYKNHALDEFIKELKSFLPDGVVRVGGRSQDPELEKCNLNSLKRDYNRSTTNAKQKQELKFEADEVKNTVEQQIKRLQTAMQFSVETLIKEFDVDQIEQLLMGSNLFDTSTKKKTLFSKTLVESLWQKNKDILLKIDLSPKEIMGMLDQVLVNLIHQALEQWIPPPQQFREIMKGEERLSQLIAAQIKDHKEDKSEDEDSDSITDEKDIEDEEKERKSAVWIPQRNQKTETIVEFAKEQDNVAMPYIGPTANRLAAQVPLLALRGIQDLWTLSNYDRVLIIQVVMWYQKEEVEKTLKVAMVKYKQLLAAIKELDDSHKISVLQKKMVVGMTITGASIHHNLLQALKPAIIIVEEAAEVLEPQLIAVLGNWVEHMILIGDHKQLRPSVESYKLARDYHLDVSMMERLINNNYPFATLKMQNRMRPEIAELLEDIYPELQSNLKRVGNNVPPDFLPSMYFWAHEDEETHDRSFSNKKEAERVVKLALLFLQQGHQAKDITILAAYQGQVKILREMMSKAEKKDYPNLFDSSPAMENGTSKTDENEISIKVHTIDMYQGDENKIIIVSLVRSNSYGQIGFLKTINRRCVAQSRAQCGMYFVGNMVTLMTAKGSCWPELIWKLNAQKLISRKIPLHCSYHHDTSMMEARTAADIPLTGLCRQRCPCDMECGLHPCVRRCQPYHQHTVDKCNEIVKFLHPICNHPLQRKCHQAASSIPCNEPCTKMMLCGKHPCPSICQPEHSHLSQYCIVKVEYSFPDCGHAIKKKCGEDETKLRCTSKVPFRYRHCTHSGTKKCWESEDQVHCKEACTRKLSCGHQCEGYCGSACDASKCKICEKMRETEKKRQREAEERARAAARRKAQKELEEFNKNNPNPDKKCYRQVLSPEGDTASQFFDVRDLVQKYVQPGHNWFPNVTKIEKVTNLERQREWLEAKTRMFDSDRIAQKFHGTGDDGVEGIINGGFRIGSKGMYGAGIYFATDSSKSAQDIYTKGSNKLLLCDVLIGKSMTVKKATPEMTGQILRKAGYDSLFASRGTAVRYDEYVVYDVAQALPKYIIHYSQFGLQDMQLTFGVPKVAGLVHHHLKPKREFSISDPMDSHFRLAESQFLRLKQHPGLTIKSVDYYINPTLIAQFISKEQEFKKKYKGDECKQILAFHGTPGGNIDNIIKNNFDMSRIQTGAYGAGMYFSEFPDVSIGYAGGSNKLILCQLLPGHSYKCPGGMNNAKLQDGYDSHIVSVDAAGRGWAVVLYNSDQVLPTYVLNF